MHKKSLVAGAQPRRRRTHVNKEVVFDSCSHSMAVGTTDWWLTVSVHGGLSTTVHFLVSAIPRPTMLPIATAAAPPTTAMPTSPSSRTDTDKQTHQAIQSQMNSDALVHGYRSSVKKLVPYGD